MMTAWTILLQENRVRTAVRTSSGVKMTGSDALISVMATTDSKWSSKSKTNQLICV